jgi:hypothetical protein
MTLVFKRMRRKSIHTHTSRARVWRISDKILFSFFLFWERAKGTFIKNQQTFFLPNQIGKSSKSSSLQHKKQKQNARKRERGRETTYDSRVNSDRDCAVKAQELISSVVSNCRNALSKRWEWVLTVVVVFKNEETIGKATGETKTFSRRRRCWVDARPAPRASLTSVR